MTSSNPTTNIPVSERPSLDRPGTPITPSTLVPPMGLPGLPGMNPSTTSTEAPPPTPEAPRNLVVLMDGTADQYSKTPSNLIKLAQVLQVDNTQLMYYDSGIGTTLPPAASLWGEITTWCGVKLDFAFAWDFAEHVQGAYRFLMDHYREGDRIYIFGFSRGSYSARCLAGMIEKVGLLPPGNISQVPLAYKVYADPTNDIATENDYTPPLAEGYRRTFGLSKLVTIHFLGVWDTVASLGGADIKELPFASSVSSILFFRHALALNERRAKFQPVYRHPDVKYKSLEQYLQSTTPKWMGLSWFFNGIFGKRPAPLKIEDENYSAKELPGGDPSHPCANVPISRTKEVWFMGCHSDVGGGDNTLAAPSLSNVSFRWMLREAEHCGLRIDPSGLVNSYAITSVQAVQQRLNDLKIVENPLVQLCSAVSGEYHKPLTLSQEAERRSFLKERLTSREIHGLINGAAEADSLGQSQDVKEGIHESLTGLWWVVEWMLLQTRMYAGGAGGSGEDHYSWRQNRGRYRRMLYDTQKIHRSVQMRLQLDQKSQSKWQRPVNLLPKNVNWDNLVKPSAAPQAGWEE